MKFSFSYKTREAMKVAYAIAREVVGHDFPTLLSIQGRNNSTFRFQGGLKISLNMLNVIQYPPRYRDSNLTESWVVLGATVCRRNSWSEKEKIREEWPAQKLQSLKDKPGFNWGGPPVFFPDSLIGEVGVYFDNASGHSAIDMDPEYSYLPGDSHLTLVDSVLYYPLVEGDLDRAKKEAKKIIDQLLVELNMK